MIDKSWYINPGGLPVRVTAGGIVARSQGNTIYLAFIREGGYKDFALPKGGVEKGESFEETARREILEEAGLSDLVTIGYLGKKERCNFSKKRWVVVHYFLFTTTQVKGTPTDTSKQHVLHWFPLEKVPYMLWPGQKQLIMENKEKIKELFRK